MLGDVTWTTPGRSSADSLPLGNGDIAGNIWTEANGDIGLYLAKNDAWDQLGRLVKIGRLRLTFDPPLQPGAAFVQKLNLAEASVTITDGTLTIKAWIDAHWPRLVLEIGGRASGTAHLKIDPWRASPHALNGRETHSATGVAGAPVPLLTLADHLVPNLTEAIGWYQRNESSIWSLTFDPQSLGDFKSTSADPLLHRTFGGLITAPGAFKTDERTLSISLEKKPAMFSVCALTAQTPTAEAWLEQIQALQERLATVALGDAWRDHCQFWHEHHARSHIEIKSRGPDWGHAQLISEQSAWQRYLVACCSRGLYPLKFNGGLFTADWGLPDEAYNADYRRWGGAYWWQNTRLPYWAMLAAGDYDLLRPLFRMYRDTLPLAEARTRRWFNHEGAFLPEQVYFWGSFLPDTYGWDRTGMKFSDVHGQYVGRLYICSLELLALMLETYAHTGDDALVENDLLPIARSVLTFYDRHYPTDASGKLRIAPAQSLETWWETENPAPDVAGLHAVLPRLLALSSAQITAGDRKTWSALLARLPALPLVEAEGKRRLLPAEKCELVPRNSENAELYAVFPFRLYGVGRAELETARWTFARRRFPDTGGWRQDAIQAALLGLPEAAAFYVEKNFTDGNQAPARFKGFMGLNYDWLPDFDHASVGQLALQAMLVQTVDDKILLFPAWPASRWNVSFKLHLSRQTVIEGRLQDGKLTRLIVSPEERRKDIVILLDAAGA